MGIQNQLKILERAAITVSNQTPNTSTNSIQNSWNIPKSTTTEFTKTTICPNCIYTWSASHRLNCPARRKKCKNCATSNRFTKVESGSRKSKIQIKPKPGVSNVGDTSSETGTIGKSATVGEQVNQIDAIMQENSIYDANYDSVHDGFDDNCVAVISDSDNIRGM